VKPALIAAIILVVAISLAPRCEAKRQAAYIAETAYDQNLSSLLTIFPRYEDAPADNEGNGNHAPGGNATPQWILIGVTAITAGFIAWQAWETKRAAKATADSVDALIASERAFIDGELVQDEEARKISVVRYKVKITNYGKTPAKMLSFRTSFGCLLKGTEFDAERLSVQIGGPLHLLLGSDRSRPIEEIEPLNVKEAFGECEGEGAYCVTIRYADVVTEGQGKQIIHETSFVYRCPFLMDSLFRVPDYDTYT
jgi:hypothetical protein